MGVGFVSTAHVTYQQLRQIRKPCLMASQPTSPPQRIPLSLRAY